MTGTVRHGFDEGALGGGGARDLEPAGAAKPFRMQFDRNQGLEAELEYQPDGRLLLRRAKWGAIR